MPKKSGITTLDLFKQVEALRIILKMSIEETAEMIDVTPLAYKNWKNHDAIPQAKMEPMLRAVIKRLEGRHRRAQEADQ